jgi:hypothetical protein
MDVALIWVRILGMPMEFWTKKIFSELGNFLGTFLDVDMSFLESGEMAVARILVSLDIQEGLIEELELIFGEKSLKHKLDYEGVPFRCRRCHQYGHIANQCSLPLHRDLMGHTQLLQRSDWCRKGKNSLNN